MSQDLIKQIVTGNKLTALIRRIGSATVKLQNDKNVAAASCVITAIEHGNVIPMRQLFAAVSESERRQAIVTWACENGPFEYRAPKAEERLDKNDTERRFMFDKTRIDGFKQQLADNRDAFIENMITRPYWQAVKEPELKPFNIHAALTVLIKRAEKANDNGLEGNYIVGLDRIKALADSLKPADKRAEKDAA